MIGSPLRVVLELRKDKSCHVHTLSSLNYAKTGRVVFGNATRRAEEPFLFELVEVTAAELDEGACHESDGDKVFIFWRQDAR